MTDTRWTPGPWSYQFKTIKDDWGEIRDSDGRLVAKCVFGRWSMQELDAHRRAKTDPSAANALLIAAAPQLFDALEAAVEALESYSDVVDGSYGEPAPNTAMKAILEANAVLRKARGE